VDGRSGAHRGGGRLFDNDDGSSSQGGHRAVQSPAARPGRQPPPPPEKAWRGPLGDHGSLLAVTDEPTQLTLATYERLNAELEDLTTRGRVEIARAIEAARALGDLSENGDYHAAKDSQGKMEARIRQLTATLKDAEIVDGTTLPDTVVATGSIVSIRYEGDDEVERFLVGSIEERNEEVSVVSPGSPLGQALLGRSPGDVVEYEAPGGTLRVEIVRIGS
jgi:transcription elongation factor GreA